MGQLQAKTPRKSRGFAVGTTFPFYSRAKQALVVAERCECGHLKSEHGSKLTRLPNGQMYRQYQHGSCCEDDCPCDQYTFAEYVTEEEAVEHLLQCRRLKVVA
jgi:hypothetical protein